MDTFLIKATQLILAFAILVIVHEFGHFLFARIFGVRVNKFYMFFNPGLTLFKWRPGKYVGFFGKKRHFDPAVGEEERLVIEREKAAEEEKARVDEQAEPLRKEIAALKRSIRFSFGGDKSHDKARLALLESQLQQAEAKAEELSSEAYRCRAAFDEKYYYNTGKSGKRKFWKHTEYGIGWLPLGGYCQIAGMIDESMDTEQMKQPAKDWEFRSKPAWQRLLIMVAGVLFNFLLAILIYAGIVYATGEKYVPVSEARMGMEWSGEARKIGFHNGDILLLADGEPLDNPAEARMKIAQAKNVTVLRGRDSVNVAIPADFLFRLDNEAKSDTALFSMMTYAIPAKVTQVMPGEGADKGGIEKGDVIVAVDSLSTPTLMQFMKGLEGHENRTVRLTVVRNGADTIYKDVALSAASKMGIGLEVDPSAFFKTREIRYNLLQSVPRGIEMGTDRLVSYAESMKLVFTKEGAKSIGGFGAIGSIFPEKWDWIAFWNIAAFLSVALAFMNILPIPALDGGHVLFLLYEVIFRRKPSEKFMEYAQITGMALLILLLLYANGMDIVRLFK